jgi:hypothetical protein
MSYQTGIASDVDDLLDKLQTFANSNGWITDKWVPGNGSGNAELYLHKGASYVIYDCYNTGGSQFYKQVSQVITQKGIFQHAATGHDGGQSAGNQPNDSGSVIANWIFDNITAYHFFTDPAQTYLHIVVETLANEFRHLLFGLSDKAGVYEGGEYSVGSYEYQNQLYFTNGQHHMALIGGGSNGSYTHQFHMNVDGVRWKSAFFQTAFTSIWAAIHGYVGGGDMLDPMIGMNDSAEDICQPNQFNQLSALWSVPCGWSIRSSTNITPFGHYPDLRVTNIKNIVPGATITLGADEWLVFPAIAKNNPQINNNQSSSGYYGIAYLKVP